MIYQSINQAVFAHVPAGTRRLLDVGCGGGLFGSAVKAAMPCEVVGLTHSEAEAAQARRLIDRVEVVDLNTADLSGLGQFECIVCSHVLEHLIDPVQLLSQLHALMRPEGSLLVALPNVLHWKQRLEFIRGRFEYTEGGLMDRTHLRFYDWHGARRLLSDAGLSLRDAHADGGLPCSRWFGASRARALDRLALARFPGLFGFQFVFRCEWPASEAARSDRAGEASIRPPGAGAASMGSRVAADEAR